MDFRPDLDAMLRAIAEGRAADPLAPVTVLCPSHIAALHLRRRLAELTPFAAVRFETLPRLAELIAAGDLAASGRRPLARPIGDHLAERVGAWARPPLAPIAALPGFGRALRRLFDRLRRGGFVGGEPAPPECGPHLDEVMRLYGLWREAMAAFYDEDDLLDAAADALADAPGRARELGRLHLVPPGPRSASGARLVAALADACGGVVTAADPDPSDDVRLVLAPDRSCEAREAARAVVAALEDGVAVDRVAVLHGADPAYARLLREALAAADLPVAAVPGIPLSETPAGRGVLALLDVAREDLSRTALVNALSVAPVRRELSAGDGRVPLRLGRWDRISRAAGVTHGRERWREGIGALCDERRARIEAARRDGATERSWLEEEILDAEALLAVVETLADRLADLFPERAAADFLGRLRALVADYLDPRAAGMEEVLGEVDRLGTIDAVGGTFALGPFQEALRVNLDAAAIREGRAGDGVLIADHRAAGGLRFDRVILCGAAEGLLPAGPGADTLVDDAAWQALRDAGHLHVEDAARRIARAREAADRAVGAGARVVLTCPLYEGAGAHEHYPSPVALAAARRRDPSIATATALREHAGGDGADWLTRVRSPLAAQLHGPVLDPWEAGLRAAVGRVHAGGAAPSPDPIARPLAMLRARAGGSLTEFDGNLAALAGSGWLAVPDVVSPTRLELYGGCGFRFLLSTLVGVRVPEEPADAETIDPVVRGSLVHETLETFFREQQAAGRPGPAEPWTTADDARVQEILTGRLEVARRLGLTGLAVFAGDAERTMRADLTTFLVADGEFRRRTGATPWRFEEPVREEGPHGQRFRGFVDRIDRVLPDGPAWVIDYKTGRVPEKDDHLGGGRLLQLPVYLLATRGIPATALYWYISARGGFAQVPFDPTPENLVRFADVVASIRAGVAAGSFPASPGGWNDFYAEFENCGRCDFTRICARSRGDDFDRKEADPGVAPWAGVRAAAAPAVAP